MSVKNRSEQSIMKDSFELLYEEAPLPYQSLDKNACLLAVNKAWEEFSGYAREQVLGRFIGDFLVPGQDEILNVAFTQFVERGAVKNQEFQFRCLNGGSKLIRVDGRISRDESGKFLRTHCILSDITEQRRTEQDLHLFKSIIEKSSEAVAIKDAAGKFVYINPAHERLFGRSKADALELHSSENFTSTSQQIIRDKVIPQLQRGLGWEGELKAIDANNRKFILWEQTDSLLNDDGELLYTFCLMHDISSKKQTENELRRKEKLLSQAELIGQVGSWELDIQNDELFWSSGCYQIFGTDPDKFETTYEAFIAKVHPDDRDTVDHAYKNSLINHLPYQVEHRLLMQDGSIKYVLERCKSDYDLAGMPLRSYGMVQDITHQRLLENILRSSEQRFRTLFKEVGAGMLMGTPDFVITEVNTEFANMLGYSKQELTGKTIQEITYPQDWQQSREKLNAVMDGKISSYRLEKRYIHKNNYPVWGLLSSTWIRDEQNQPDYFIALVQNLDEQKLVENKLRESLAERALMLNTIPIGIGLVINRKFQWCSERFVKMTGYSEQQLIGKSTRILYVDDEYDRVGRVKYEQIKQTGYGEVETQMLKSDGSSIDVLLCSSALDPENLSEGVMFSALDISNLKNTEAFLQERNAELRALLDTIPAPVYFEDNNMKFQDVNQAFLDLIKLNKEEVIGKRNIDIFPSQMAEGIVHTDQEVINNGRFFRDLEQSFNDANGNWHYYSTMKTPVLDKNNEVNGLVGVSFDVTERKAFETQRIAHEKEARNALIREIHHRIKNHLQGVVGLLHNISIDGQPTTEKLEQAITQVRTIATVYGLQLKTDQGSVNLYDLIQASAEFHRVYGPIKVESQIDESHSITINQEETVPIALIINELITNAIKHSWPKMAVIPVSICLYQTETVIGVRVSNSCRPNVEKFDLNNKDNFGHGLSLVHTLLPQKGANLTVFTDTEKLMVELELDDHVIQRH